MEAAKLLTYPLDHQHTREERDGGSGSLARFPAAWRSAATSGGPSTQTVTVARRAARPRWDRLRRAPRLDEARTRFL